MFPVSPSAWQVHLVSVSLQTPGSTWRHLRASLSFCLSILITTAQHSLAGQVPFSLPKPTQAPRMICYLQTSLILGKSENFKLIFFVLRTSQGNNASKARRAKFSLQWP